MNGKFKDLVAAGLVLALTGCASLDGAVKSHANNTYKLSRDGSGIVYGLLGTDMLDISSACAAINNTDSRCLNKEKYKAMTFGAGVGFASAFAGGTVLVEKSGPSVSHCVTGGGKGCTYAKVKAEPGKFGTILEVYKEGENGCHWAGMPRMGGVVCNDWDYRKDMRDWDTTNGVMTVKDN